MPTALTMLKNYEGSSRMSEWKSLVLPRQQRLAPARVRISVRKDDHRVALLNKSAMGLVGADVERVTPVGDEEGRYGLRFGPSEAHKVTKQYKKNACFGAGMLPEGVYSLQQEGEIWVLGKA